MNWNVIGLAAVLATLMTCVGTSQAQDRESLQNHLSSVEASFESNPDRFKQLLGETAPAVALVEDDHPRRSSPARVIAFDEAQGAATVLLSGRLVAGVSGDQTFNALLYSGLHRMRWTGQQWHIADRIPMEANAIVSQDLRVELQPGRGIRVEDVIEAEVDSEAGFFFGLNLQAKVDDVTVDGRKAAYAFQDGFFWVDAPRGRHRMKVSYQLEVEQEMGGNSAMFGGRFGHLRNQNWWHPFMGFGIDRGDGEVRVSIQAPERFRIATDLPQQESVSHGVRTVVARSTGKVGAVSWAYDDAWTPRHYQVGDVRLDIFATADYAPSDEVLKASVAQAVHVLSARFGMPQTRRIAIIQARGRDGAGWHFLSNQAIFTGVRGGSPTRLEGYPIRGFLGHEVAHLWTRPSGAARNFLAEGWATYAESLLIEDLQGAERARWFWRDQARLFAASTNANTTALDNDPSNGGVAYSKGAWVLAMLERAVGRAAFYRGMRAFAAAPQGRTSYEDFLRSFGPDAATAERFLTPWVKEMGAATIKLEQAEGRLILRQPGPAYWLPGFELLLEMEDGSMHWRTVDIAGSETFVPLDAPVRQVHLDPLEKVLLVAGRMIDLDPRPSQAEKP